MTVHPSYLLRLPDADAKAREYQRFVEDLKIAAALLQDQRAPPRHPNTPMEPKFLVSTGPRNDKYMYNLQLRL